MNHDAKELNGQIVEVLGNAKFDSQSSKEETTEHEESELESDDSEFGLFGFKDMSAEIAACENEMSQFMRLNIIFSQISTPQFGAFIRNE